MSQKAIENEMLEIFAREERAEPVADESVPFSVSEIQSAMEGFSEEDKAKAAGLFGKQVKIAKERVVEFVRCKLCQQNFPKATKDQKYCTRDHKLLAHYERRLVEMGRVVRVEGALDPYGI